MTVAAPKGKTVPVIADYDQVVEIHWRQPNGTSYVERFSYPVPPAPPPAATTEP